MADQGEGEVELSDEMLEAIRILKSDQQTLSFAQMTASHQALVERLDREAEERKSEREKKEEDGKNGEGDKGDEGKGGSGSGGGDAVPDGPLPPPRKEEGEGLEGEEGKGKKGRVAWWERDNYSRD